MSDGNERISLGQRVLRLEKQLTRTHEELAGAQGKIAGLQVALTKVLQLLPEATHAAIDQTLEKMIAKMLASDVDDPWVAGIQVTKDQLRPKR